MQRHCLFSSLVLMTVAIAANVASSPVVDFQLLLDPKGIQASLQKMAQVKGAVAKVRAELEDELRKLGGSEEFKDAELASDSLLQKSGSSMDYKDILAKHAKLRTGQEKASELKQEILATTSFAKTLDELRDLVSRGTEGQTPNSGFIQFSKLRSLVKTLRILSFDIFTPDEAAVDFGEICLNILKIRKPTVNMKTDYKNFCF